MVGAGEAGEPEGGGSDTMLRFVVTVIVSTLLAAVTAWALSYAVLAPERVGSTHAGAAAIQRAHS